MLLIVQSLAVEQRQGESYRSTAEEMGYTIGVPTDAAPYDHVLQPGCAAPPIRWHLRWHLRRNIEVGLQRFEQLVGA